jgi:hypothetical protein
MHEEIKFRECMLHLVQSLLNSHLLSKSFKFKIYRTIILPAVLYVCETPSLKLRKEHILRVFEKRVMRIFGPKREKVAGGSRRLHSEAS